METIINEAADLLIAECFEGNGEVYDEVKSLLKDFFIRGVEMGRNLEKKLIIEKIEKDANNWAHWQEEKNEERSFANDIIKTHIIIANSIKDEK